jgi:hypothetical protein
MGTATVAELGGVGGSTFRFVTEDGRNVTLGRYAVTLSNSYATGGDTVPLTPFFIGIINANVVGQTAASNQRFWSLNISATQPNAGTVLLLAYQQSAHTHVLRFQTAAAANAVTAQANQLRTAAAAFDVAGVNDNSAEGGVVGTGTAIQTPFTQVPNATDLSASVVHIEVWGYS